MMSAAAVASGTGGVAAGSSVAVLQSVGAVGFGAALPVMGITTVALGAATGLGFGIYKGVKSFTTPPQPSAICDLAVTLPFLKVSILAPNGMFLRVLGGGRGNWFFDWQQKKCYTGVVKAEAKVARAWEHFTVHACGGRDEACFALQSHHGAFLSTKSNGEVVADVVGGVGKCEKFRFVRLGGGGEDEEGWYGYFQAWNGSYLTVNHSHAHWVANALSVAEAGLFEISGIGKGYETLRRAYSFFDNNFQSKKPSGSRTCPSRQQAKKTPPRFP